MSANPEFDDQPVRVGLVGAGQWARAMHAPMHAAGKETTLSGIWSPHPQRAADLAAEFGVPAFTSFEELVERSEAVDFAVPPGVQAELAVRAAVAGRALLLEKPLADSLTGANAVVDAIDAASVPSLVFFTKRFQKRTREFLGRAREIEGGILAVTGRYVHGGFLDTGFVEKASRSGWRSELGVLFDLGPHLLDLADAAAGPIHSVRVTGNPAEAILVSTAHAGGAIGDFLLSGRVDTLAPLTDVDVYAHSGQIAYSTRGLDLGEAVASARSEFARAVRNAEPVTVDAHRALRIQRIIDAAAQSLREGRTIEISELSDRS